MRQRVAVIDFETNGATPGGDCRATEIGVAMVEDGRVVDRFHSLMNAGVWVPPMIERLTGISNAMLKDAPPAERVMRDAAHFVGDAPLAAHNAGFDRKFWDYELGLLGLSRRQDFACTLLLSRRLLPQAPDHKLGTLARWAGLPDTGRAHRAMADAEMAAQLMLLLGDTLSRQFHLADIDHALLCKLQKVTAAKVKLYLRELQAATAA
ncbi:3'-5' exonuclease [Chromobacterium violaceum]|uniref:DNA polymerase III polC-type n=1 Tax=Chromobacterium violaceum TaxID=536 RepID=A0A381EU27_CHRVL|nr:3'-5' exonuclease [Chromobacterium violaceum]OLZ87514.1 DNA polymerase III subunit epsilon [Chromobacterium violaceum]OQS08797.1 DNA polymerase III subunit epsilon [Chromobacterium violaceum]OQS23005.1 DNA polymerase III subunit epsilon [Chromobacterium violaceum]QIY81105.1 3'-5' exonuclease [Chromobacterium violaceum]STB64110.1 DNA polymerase III polC-type [Chromobacterium violaceum]